MMFYAIEYFFQPVDVHQFMQAILQYLVNQRVIRDFTFTLYIFEAGKLIREYQRNQVFGIITLKWRRDFFAATKTRYGERDVSYPAPASREHGGIQQCLHQDMLNAVRLQVTCRFIQWKAVGRTERQDQVVFVGCGLQFEIEASAETFA